MAQKKSDIPDAKVVIRPVASTDVKQLDLLEKSTFETDRLSLRRFKHWIQAANRIFLVADVNHELAGYGLVLLHKGTRLARLYSLAVDQRFKGRGIGKQLLVALEKETGKNNRLYLRLEVASDNQPAIALYKSLGYRVFRWISDYYEDHRNALHMQKRIRYLADNLIKRPIPWYQQTTEFTCGPASLIMAMASLDKKRGMTQDEELDIWREATTIFMTSGHGGSHPIGLGLAARKRGFSVEVYLNQESPLFIDGVRSEDKKKIMIMVDQQFRAKAKMQGVHINKDEIDQQRIAHWLEKGKAVLILISTYRFDGRKAPLWVLISGIDDQCIYLHDPDPAAEHYTGFD